MNATHAALFQGLLSSSRKFIATGFVVGLGLVALLAIAPGAHAQLAAAPGGGAGPSLPPNAIPLNMPGTYTLPAPPAGFDPQTASPAALQAYGMPPAPDKQTNPKAYAAWLNAVSIPNRITPTLQKTNIYHRPLQAAPARAQVPMGVEQEPQENSTLTDSYNWSGYAVYNSAEPFQIEAVAGTYVAPVARNPFGQCPSNPYYDVYEASWAGIDGLGSSVVFQGGTEADSYNDCAGSYQYYYAWLEWYPGPTYLLLDAPVEGGDYIFIENWTASTTSGCWFWANESEQWATSVCSSASSVGGSAVAGASVEWIVERPYTGEHATGFGYLTNYVTIPWSETFAYNYTSGSPTYNYPGSAPSGAVYQIYAVDDSGGLISYPYLVGVDSILFYDYGSAYCAPGASCVPRY
jgi:Peptidase A4 family